MVATEPQEVPVTTDTTAALRAAETEEATYDMVNTMATLKSAPQEAEMIAGSTNDEYSKTMFNIDEYLKSK